MRFKVTQMRPGQYALMAIKILTHETKRSSDNEIQRSGQKEDMKEVSTFFIYK